MSLVKDNETADNGDLS